MPLRERDLHLGYMFSSKDMPNEDVLDLLETIDSFFVKQGIEGHLGNSKPFDRKLNISFRVLYSLGGLSFAVTQRRGERALTSYVAIYLHPCEEENYKKTKELVDSLEFMVAESQQDTILV